MAMRDGGQHIFLTAPLWIHAQELLEVLFDQSEKRRLARPPRPVDPTGDLHAQPRTGGKAPAWAKLALSYLRAPSRFDRPKDPLSLSRALYRQVLAHVHVLSWWRGPLGLSISIEGVCFRSQPRGQASPVLAR
jgi:hypothetical protein